MKTKLSTRMQRFHVLLLFWLYNNGRGGEPSRWRRRVMGDRWERGRGFCTVHHHHNWFQSSTGYEKCHHTQLVTGTGYDELYYSRFQWLQRAPNLEPAVMPHHNWFQRPSGPTTLELTVMQRGCFCSSVLHASTTAHGQRRPCCQPSTHLLHRRLPKPFPDHSYSKPPPTRHPPPHQTSDPTAAHNSPPTLGWSVQDHPPKAACHGVPHRIPTS